jgi:hypothetical protein
MLKIRFDCLPPSELRANNHSSNYWYRRADASRLARNYAYILGKKLHLRKPVKTCEIEEVFTVPAKRRIDVEGLLGAAKPWIDGLQDAGVIENDDWQHVRRLSGRVIYKKGIEQTEIVIKELK